MALVFFQLGFETFKQGKGVGGAASETGNHLAVKKPTNLAGVALHDSVAQADLAIATDDHVVTSTNRNNGCTAILLHGNSPFYA